MGKFLLAVLMGILLVGCSSEKTSVGSDRELLSTDIVYIMDKTENAKGFSKGLNNFSDTLENPTLTEDWVYDLAISLGRLQVLIDDAKKLEPPSKFEDSHEYYMKAVDQIQIIVDELPSAIANLDEKQIYDLVGNMEKANEYLALSTDEFNSIQKEYGYSQ